VAIANGSFEVEGAEPGLALGWSSTFVSSLEEWADFDGALAGGTRSQEAFEREVLFVRALLGETIDTEAAVFNVGAGQVPVERFELAWGTVGMAFLGELNQSEAASFSSQEQERFEEDWGTVAFGLPDGVSIAAFGDGSREDFEHGWFAVPEIDYSPAVFAGSGSVENFELNVPEAITADVDDTLTLDYPPNTALANGQLARFETDDTLPAPLLADVTYFIVEVSSAFAFKVSEEEDGDPVDLTDDGAGDSYLVRVWWSQLLTTV
jgi:hypothetical protein